MYITILPYYLITIPAEKSYSMTRFLCRRYHKADLHITLMKIMLVHHGKKMHKIRVCVNIFI